MITAIVLIPVTQVMAGQWYFIKKGRNFAVSGMALIKHNDDSCTFIVVHDNKKRGEPRLGLLTIDKKRHWHYLSLSWPDNIELPVDLEAITFIPGSKEPSFIALTSEGKAYHIKLNLPENRLSVIKVFSLPSTYTKNFEGFALQEINGRLLSFWASRGSDKEPAIIYWGFLDLDTYNFFNIGSAVFSVPWPARSEVRHISDLKVNSYGVLFVSSASDPGDNGPFESAVYLGGVFFICNNNISFKYNNQPVRLYSFKSHKVEALELVPGYPLGLAVASDDENKGGFVYWDW